MRSKTALWVIIALVVAYAVISENEDTPPPPQDPVRGSQLRPYKPGQSYALNVHGDSWPPLDHDAEVSSDPSNLFAINYYVILDGSGSMKDFDCSPDQEKIDAARIALASFAGSLPADANLGLFVFDTRGLSERLSLGADNRDRFIEAVNEVVADGNTPLKAAVTASYGKLLSQAKRQLGYGEYHLVTVTDGMATPGQDPTKMVNKILAESPVVFHTIGFCINDDHSLNQPGRTYYRSADNPEALRRGLDEVLAEAPSFPVTDFRD